MNNGSHKVHDPKNAEHKRRSRENQALFVNCLIGLLIAVSKKTIGIKCPLKIYKEGSPQYFQIIQIDNFKLKNRKVRSIEEVKIIKTITNEVVKGLSPEQKKMSYCQPGKVGFVRYNWIYPFLTKESFYKFGRNVCELIKEKLVHNTSKQIVFIDNEMVHKINGWVESERGQLNTTETKFQFINQKDIPENEKTESDNTETISEDFDSK
ncbi:Hypothetical protein EHI5A_060710 [Entamoeba histolytica KU27]|uniref:Uncharacterized protein n=1 Tax=Entamoeba histolytica KU27 TaxID=885311 RepID=M2QD98_ENTHI|nr:Hypothetical protein EHI5A_060710 [Entamoeba histolytica KU27]